MGNTHSRQPLRLAQALDRKAARVAWHAYSKAFARQYQRKHFGRLKGKDTSLRLTYSLRPDSDCGKAIIECLQKVPQLREKYLVHALSIFIALILADTFGGTGSVSFSRRPESYSVPKGHTKPFLRYAATKHAVQALVECGLATETRSKPWPEGRGKRSTLCLSLKAAKLAYSLNWAQSLVPLQDIETEAVIVKDRHTKRPIKPPCPDTFASYQSRIASVNQHIAKCRITVPDAFIAEQSPDGRVLFVRNPDKPMRAPVIVAPNDRRRLRMPFLINFEHGGRPVGWDAQVLPRAVRLSCLLNGAPAAEVDLQGSHIAAAYCLSGFDSPDYDPYETTARDLNVARKIVKRAALCALNCTSFHEAQGALKNYMLTQPEYDLHDEEDHSAVLAVAGAILIHLQNVHAKIASCFFSDFGIKAQASEARIMLTVLEQAMERGFHIVPLHDGVLCPKNRVNEVSSILKMAWWFEFNKKSPSIERKQKEDKKKSKKPHPPYVERFLGTKAERQNATGTSFGPPQRSPRFN